MKELKRDKQAPANLSKKDRLAQQLMLPRMNKNSKKIAVQKKKKNGPVFQKYDVKRGVTQDEPESREAPRPKPIRPITPKDMLGRKPKARSNNEMMRKMFYSKKELLRVNRRDLHETKEPAKETKEEMMYRMLRDKTREKKSSGDREGGRDEDGGRDRDGEHSGEDPEPRRLENYRNKNQRKGGCVAKTPRREGNMQPVMKKSNSMLPVNKKIFPRESPMKTYGQDPVPSRLVPPGLSQFNESGEPSRKKTRRNLSSFNREKSKSREQSQKSGATKKSTSMRPAKSDTADPFKGYRRPQPKYNKSILKEILELEDKFMQDLSRHIDSMVALVKQDIGTQADIQEQRGPTRVEESVTRLRRTLRDKRRAMDQMEGALSNFEERLGRLKRRKEDWQQGALSARVPLWNPREEAGSGLEAIRAKTGAQGMSLTSGSMYGLGPKQPLRPLSMLAKDLRGGDRANGVGGPGEKGEAGGGQMMREQDQNYKGQGRMGGEKKELRPIMREKARLQVCMLPQVEMRQKGIDENGKQVKETQLRMRTDTGTSKDLMKDLDFDNELSLI